MVLYWPAFVVSILGRCGYLRLCAWVNITTTTTGALLNRLWGLLETKVQADTNVSTNRVISGVTASPVTGSQVRQALGLQ